MHSSRMRTARSLILSPYLVISDARPPRHAALLHHACPLLPCMPPFTTHPPFTRHAPQQPHMPPATTHAPWQPCMPSPCGQTDTCKNITFANFVLWAVTRMHPSRMHTTCSSSSPWGCVIASVHAGIHTHPQLWAWRPPWCGLGDFPPWRPAAMHAGIHFPPVNRMTDRCENITLPQLRCGR